ncbi:L-lactate permease, partial [Mammaliicoccus lentus]
MDLLIALIPLIMIFICLFIFKLSALYSGLIAFLFTSALVLVGVNFELSLSELLDSIIAGILISSIAAYVIFFGILLFHLMNETKNIDLISQKIKLLTNDKALKVIILVVGISPLIESTSGFGTSFLIITPILISLGIENYKATFIGILSLIAVPWGALATGTVIGTELVGLGLKKVGFITALLTIPTIIYFLALCIFILGGKKAVNQNKYKILLYSVTFTLTNI